MRLKPRKIKGESLKILQSWICALVHDRCLAAATVRSEDCKSWGTTSAIHGLASATAASHERQG